MPFQILTPDNTPAKVIMSQLTDPAMGWPGAPPNFGQEHIPHIFTQVGRYGTVSRAYSYADEALQHSWQNAQIMRNEPAIMECIEARMRCVSLLNWHIQPLDEDFRFVNPQSEAMRKHLQKTVGRQSSYDARELAAQVQQIIMHSPRFTQLRYSLMDAIWFGRYATANRFTTMNIGGEWRTTIKSWQPRHGDKLVFRYDDGSYEYDPDQVGIRVGPAHELNGEYIDMFGQSKRRIEPTQFGLTYWLDPVQRKTFCLHKHIIEDADFNEPLKAGSIHGVGIRSRIYWTWWAYQECLKLLLEYIERSALGIEIWRYPAHNAEAERRTMEAAKNRSSGRSAIMVPVMEGQQADMYGVEIVEPGLGGVGELQSVLQTFFAHKIKRYIMGQTLTSEAEGTGLGSGVADAHLATFHDIVRFDAINLEETLTDDLVRHIQLWNFPDSGDIRLRFVIDTESPAAETKLAAYQMAWNMGAKIREEDIYSVLGSSMPQENDKVLQNPQFAQLPPQPMAAPMPQAGSDADIVPLQFAADADNDPHPDPSDAQRQAGNYRKKHLRLHGLPITIENVKGSKRRPEWKPLAADYGYIKRTEGRDGDHVDCFVGGQPYSEFVAIIDQVTAGGRFDEHKVVLGCCSEDQARRLYLANYPDGWKCGPITTMTVDQFKAWLEHGDTTKRVADQVSRFGAQLSFDFDRDQGADNATDAHPSTEKAVAPPPVPSPLAQYPEKIPTADGRMVDRPPIFLSGSHNSGSKSLAADMPNVGLLLTPKTANYADHLHHYQFCGIDNGCFSGAGNFDETGFYRTIDRVKRAGHGHKVLFATAPDVFDPVSGKGDWHATLKRSMPHLDRIRSKGVPAALVLQDGATAETVPWDKTDVLFVGGSTNFKLGGMPDDPRKTNYDFIHIMREAKRRKVPVHFGRVNSGERLDVAHYGLGGHSVDGTYLAFGPDVNAARLRAFLSPWGKFPERFGADFDQLERFGQLSFSWDESSHPRETTAHDNKHPGEFAPKGDEPAVQPHGSPAMSENEAWNKAKGDTSYAKAVSATMLYTGTMFTDWTAVPVIDTALVDDGRGNMVPMPKFAPVPSTHKHAPVLFKSGGGQSECELCGHKIKRGYPIQNDKAMLHMTVGSECVNHFMQASGEALAKAGQKQVVRDLIDRAFAVREKLIQHGSYWTRGWQGRQQQAWARHTNWGSKAEGMYKAIKAAMQWQKSEVHNKTLGYGPTKDEPLWTDRQLANWFKKHGEDLKKHVGAAEQWVKKIDTEGHPDPKQNNYEGGN